MVSRVRLDVDQSLTPVEISAEYEFYQFRTPVSVSTSERGNQPASVAEFLAQNNVNALPSLTQGMFGYSLTRPVQNQEYYYEIFNSCEKLKCEIEGWHTESGPGVYEAVGIKDHKT